MEIKRFIVFMVMITCPCLLLHPTQALAQIKMVSPPAYPLKLYSVRDGNMYIELSKHLSRNSLDSFIKQYNLTSLGLLEFIETSALEHLQKMGWKLALNDDSRFIITKPLTSSNDLGDFSKKIVYTEKSEYSERFPKESMNIIFGYNLFSKSRNSFAVNGSVVTFFLRGYSQAKKVMLAGSFNDWNPDVLAMKKNDSGWVAHVQLRPGKYWYKFVADGNWMVDNDNLLHEDDGYGNTNSIYFQCSAIFRLDTFLNAKKVFLTGSFNNWNEKQLPMLKTSKEWILPLYLSNGTYSYKYIVDGKWIPDPENPHRLPDGNQGFNSILALGKPYNFRLAGFTNARQVILSGTFNNWSESELYLYKTTGGWELPYILKGGNYEYKFIVDGNWITDPANPVTLGNEQGTKNSFLVIDSNYTFRLKGFSRAKSVYLTGDFNNWAPETMLMKQVGNEWTFSVHLSPGKHKYKFVVDGNWITDPDNKLWEQNEYDTGNSVVWISE